MQSHSLVPGLDMSTEHIITLKPDKELNRLLYNKRTRQRYGIISPDIVGQIVDKQPRTATMIHNQSSLSFFIGESV